ncbi:hybrid sensor histidine kinase/response regulator transcription factor [Mariniflexile sp.]|uniref:hybrid sensor histidine kinase/response regulator transcription factor n=1 Tax=Mariniflexile sp. TaxID=1979402 RepID=UPI0040489984
MLKVIISFLILSLPSAQMLFCQEYFFKHYRAEDGLSHNTVHCILQDKTGFIWFGTKDGLNRFDGYNFKIFQNNPDDPKSLGSNFIECLHEYNDSLWIGTGDGLFRYNEKNEEFELLETTLNLPILDIDHDHDGNLWYIAGTSLFKYQVSTQKTTVFDAETFFHNEDLTSTPDGNIWTSYGNYLYHYEKGTDSFKRIEITTALKPKLPYRVNKLFAIDNHTLLIGTENHGALSFNIKEEKAKELLPKTEEPLYVRDFIINGNDELWIATESGIYIYNLKSKTYKALKKSYNNPYALSDNAVYALSKDKEGGIWIGTYFGGVNYYPKQYAYFNKYFPKIGENSISGNAVREIREDAYGNLWIGTEDAGLNKFNPSTGIFTNYKPSGERHTLSHYNIHAILPRGDKLWIGTFEHGLDILDTQTGRIIKKYKTGEGNGLSSNFIYGLYEDKAKQVFAISKSGIQSYHAENDRFSTVEAFPEGIFFTALLQDHNGLLWAGSYWDGLLYFDPKTKIKGVFKHDNTNPNSISSNAINGIFQDSKKNLWITTENGLNLYRDHTHDFKTYSKKDGFPSNVFYSIIEDDKKQLWISTSKGLVTFDPLTNDMTVYTTENGLLSDQFNYNSAYKNKAGTMYFGSVDGLISFNPSEFTKNNYRPPILITGLQINNKEVPVNNGDSPLKKSITFTDKLQLKPNQSSFSIDFAALSYTAPRITNYWYKLEGLNNDWVYLKKNRRVNFNKLPSGNYSFKVKSLNSNGIWSEEASTLKIAVLPTFWKSNMAYALYTLLTALTVFFGFRFYHSRIKAKNHQLIEKLNNKKEKEIYKARIEFFTNISHEIRTPLTLIKSPLEKLLKKENKDLEMVENLSIMDKNTSRLLDLTNQLLDFRKTELDYMTLTFVETNISGLLRDTYARFSHAIKDKSIDFKLILETEDVFAYVDTEAIKKILSNLFNNAIKYAEKQVIVTLEQKEDFLELKVKNDGTLIPSHLKNKIFEPFFRMSGTKNQGLPGTGIGLSLAYSLTELHNGNLRLDVGDASMNVFVFNLPIHQEKEFDLYDSKERQKAKHDDQPSIYPKTDDYKPVILLVEDNEDLLDFVAKDLMEDYLVLKATHAEAALKLIKDENIQLVISDVMMPGMDGFTLCEKIKTDLESSHLPIILLTAQTALTAKIEGLEVGADAYIEKPFSMEYLKVQVANLIDNRKHIMAYYSSSPLAHIRSIAHTKTDETFIKKLDEFIYSNISDPDLNVEALAEAMNMSRSTFYRKIKDMSNLNPNELVNIARLKKAAELLKSGDYKIYEIAEMVGYKSATSFGRNFQKQFNMTPSEYVNG